MISATPEVNPIPSMQSAKAPGEFITINDLEAAA
jgi:hypothetical protein